MATVRVWAPIAGKVEVIVDDLPIPMENTGAGWWTAEQPGIVHGTRYAFMVDGEGPFPDPRSPWQPDGVHGASCWVDHARFPWTPTGFRQPPLASALIYEMHVGTFTPEGTFDAAIERLDHLIELGVTHLELMPVAEYPGNRGWGYDGVALYAPHHAYGGPEGLKHLVDACHQKGLAVLLDVVYNHLGPAGNYLGRFGPYFTDRDVTPWGDAVNLDGPDSLEVRRFFVDNALMWLRDYHMDGLRIDAVHAIVDTSAIHFLEQLASEVRSLEAHLGRPLVLIAESDLNDPRVVRPPALGGYGIDAQWNEDFHHALHAALTGERDGYYADFGTLDFLARAITKGLVYDGCYSTYRRRVHGRPFSGLSPACFVGCLQNHDQVGNRALGERTSHLLTPGQLKIGAALVLLSPFVSMLFQGEEWGASTPFLYFTDHPDPELGAAVCEGRRREFAAFGWNPESIPDPQANETFLRSKLKWGERAQSPHDGILQWHRELLALRKSLPAFTAARFEDIAVDHDEVERWMTLTLTNGDVCIACNFSEAPQRIPCGMGSSRELILASEEGVAIEEEGILLPGNSVALFRCSAVGGERLLGTD